MLQRYRAVSRAFGIGGTAINGNLVQVGGAQNTINRTPDIAPFPIGPVLLGVARPSGCGFSGTREKWRKCQIDFAGVCYRYSPLARGCQTRTYAGGVLL